MSKNLNVMSNYMIQKDIDTEKFFTGDMPETGSIIPFLQKQLHGIAEAAMKADATEEKEIQYQSVISMVYTLVEDGKLTELNQIIKNAFPEYYH